MFFCETRCRATSVRYKRDAGTLFQAVLLPRQLCHLRDQRQPALAPAHLQPVNILYYYLDRYDLSTITATITRVATQLSSAYRCRYLSPSRFSYLPWNIYANVGLPKFHPQPFYEMIAFSDKSRGFTTTLVRAPCWQTTRWLDSFSCLPFTGLYYFYIFIQIAQFCLESETEPSTCRRYASLFQWVHCARMWYEMCYEICVCSSINSVLDCMKEGNCIIPNLIGGLVPALVFFCGTDYGCQYSRKY